MRLVSVQFLEADGFLHNPWSALAMAWLWLGLAMACMAWQELVLLFCSPEPKNEQNQKRGIPNKLAKNSEVWGDLTGFLRRNQPERRDTGETSNLNRPG